MAFNYEGASEEERVAYLMPQFDEELRTQIEAINTNAKTTNALKASVLKGLVDAQCQTAYMFHMVGNSEPNGAKARLELGRSLWLALTALDAAASLIADLSPIVDGIRGVCAWWGGCGVVTKLSIGFWEQSKYSFIRYIGAENDPLQYCI